MPEVLDDLALALVERLQEGFPVCAEPFHQVACELGVSSLAVITTLQRLLDQKVLTRFGPLFQIEQAGGAFVLAAMAVPEARFEYVTQQVNAFPQVAHNYRRTHLLNMWFVLATETPEGIGQAKEQIEACTGLPVLLFPKEREYFVEMKLPPRISHNPQQGQADVR